jgi:hypothetical protein
MKMMKILKLQILVPAIVGVSALFLLSGAAFGSNVIFNLDENCNGTLVSNATFPVPCSLSVDPVSGATTVFYHLLGAGGGIVSGDVYIFDSSIFISDLLRFNADLGGVFAFSNDTGSLADIGIPFPDPANPVISMNEVDLGGGIFGVNYTPTDPTSPGLVDVNPGGVTYAYVSDPVVTTTSDTPEPATYLLIAGSLLLLSLRWRRLRTFER